MITVYHLQFDLFKQGVLLTGVDLKQKHYTPVALVMTDHIGSAYGLTQHPDTKNSWTNHPEVSVLPAPPYRSSMVGDLLMNNTSELYMVLGVGYKRVTWGEMGIMPYFEIDDELSDEFLYGEATELPPFRFELEYEITGNQRGGQASPR